MNVTSRAFRLVLLVGMVLATMWFPVSTPTFASRATATCPGSTTQTGSINGRVTYADSGLPAGNVGVIAFYQASSTSTFQLGFAFTDSTGVYSVTGLLPGTYFVRFEPQFDITTFKPSTYAVEYYSDKSTIGTATPVTVQVNQATRGIDEALEHGQSISGTVTAADTGKPLQGVVVHVFEAMAGVEEFTLGGIVTAADGTYASPPVKAGSYKVGFNAENVNKAAPSYPYLSQYYNNKASLDQADPVTVNGTTPTTGINAVLQRGGVIAGTVTGAGTPLPGAIVTVYGGTSILIHTPADALGKYEVAGLPTGTYTVKFSSPAESAYVSLYYNSQVLSSNATPVAVTAPTTTTVNQDLPIGGRIKGRVTDPNGKGVESAYVFVYDSSGNNLESAFTDATGTYTTSGLLSGNYRLAFTAAQYPTVYYNQKATLKAADAVAVTAPNITQPINAQLMAGGKICGQVTDASTSKPVSGVLITIYNANGDAVAFGFTGKNGNYSTFQPLLPGQYRIKFSATGYADQYFDNKPTLAAATPVNVVANDNTIANAALGPGSTAKLTYIPIVRR